MDRRMWGRVSKGYEQVAGVEEKRNVLIFIFHTR